MLAQRGWDQSQGTRAKKDHLSKASKKEGTPFLWGGNGMFWRPVLFLLSFFLGWGSCTSQERDTWIHMVHTFKTGWSGFRLYLQCQNPTSATFTIEVVVSSRSCHEAHEVLLFRMLHRCKQGTQENRKLQSIQRLPNGFVQILLPTKDILSRKHTHTDLDLHPFN